MARIRYSLQEVQNKYDTGEDRSQLENLVRAFRGIQLKPPTDPNSFFMIAGFHGEPFRKPSGKEAAEDPDYWGGYCNHGNILFPTWHRPYVLRLEQALQSIPGCQNVMLPFWDECFSPGSKNPIPSCLTSPTFTLDGREEKNPLYSYKLQQALVEEVTEDNQRYSKPLGYDTVRYPLSGLVGTPEDIKATEVHNSAYRNTAKNIEILNGNVAAWMDGTVKITPDPVSGGRVPDTYSVLAKYRLCLNAPNYTTFSNTTSQNQWIKDHKSTDPHYVVSLESPHNAIHLAVGGFYQAGVYNADPILGANGDMGDNETAGFDPLFFFHHCFVDYVFWTWQRKMNCTVPGSLTILPGYAGTVSEYGLPNIPVNTPLNINTPLYPFEKSPGVMFTSYDVTNIEHQLGYGYGHGSLDILVEQPKLGAPESAPIVGFKRAYNINRANYAGSFVIRTFAKLPSGDRVEIGRDAILSRWSVKNCANCQDKLDVESLVPIDRKLLLALGGKTSINEIDCEVEIQTHHGVGLKAPKNAPNLDLRPIVGDL